MKFANANLPVYMKKCSRTNISFWAQESAFSNLIREVFVNILFSLPASQTL